jgi:hypothetical protein
MWRSLPAKPITKPWLVKSMTKPMTKPMASFAHPLPRPLSVAASPPLALLSVTVSSPSCSPLYWCALLCSLSLCLPLLSPHPSRPPLLSLHLPLCHCHCQPFGHIIVLSCLISMVHASALRFFFWTSHTDFFFSFPPFRPCLRVL